MMNSINSLNSTSYTSQADSISATRHRGKAEEQKPAEQQGGLEFSYNPQDELVMQPGTIKLPNVRVSKGMPQGENVRFMDERTKLKPNDDGSYVFKPGTRQFIASNSLATVQATVNAMAGSFGSEINWSFGDKQIKLVPDGGVMLNAYYSRDDESLNFFHDKDPVTSKQVYSGSSGEVISHEVGHAILDGQRPGYFTSWQADTNGFHEAFADLTGLFMATQSDEVCELAAQETGGDMHKPNCLAASGELLGSAINNQEGQNVTGGNYIRNFINDFKWQSPRTVDPHPSGTDPLTTEMHSWSRIFTGAQYDVLSAITERNIANGMEPARAIKSAGQESMKLLTEAVKMAPQDEVTFRDIALLMLKADAQNGGADHDIILNTMMDRNILFEGDDTPSDMQMASLAPSRNATITLDGPEFGKFAGAEVTGRVPGGFSVAENSESSLAADMKQLIQNGSILYTEPNQTVEKKDLFDKNGNAYIGVVRWTDGKMVIERNNMIS